MTPAPCPDASKHNPIQRGGCEKCFAWFHRDHIDLAQKLGWKDLSIEWRDHYDNANDYHFQIRGINPDWGTVEDVPDDLPRLTVIEVTVRPGDGNILSKPSYLAKLKGEVSWGCGPTREEAIGALVCSCPERFGIVISDLETTRP